jgi:hypothetical protein
LAFLLKFGIKVAQSNLTNSPSPSYEFFKKKIRRLIGKEINLAILTQITAVYTGKITTLFENETEMKMAIFFEVHKLVKNA